MHGRKPQDRFYFGLGACARHIGETGDAFRPDGPINPLDWKNRFLRLPIAFVSAAGSGRHTNVHGEVLWHAMLDGSYTRPGDYLVVGGGTYFVASQAPLLPVLCVRTNRVVSVSQESIHTSAALNAYGGYTPSLKRMLAEKWPASVLGEGHLGTSRAGLPTDQAVPVWRVLLPAIEGVILSPGNIMTDDLGRTAIISGAELTDLGWRVSAKMATT
jgi:hypothetical protein